MNNKFSKYKILIIDDEQDIVDILKTVLERDGFDNIFIANNGVDGIELFKKVNPDIILLDIMLPDIIGYDVFNELRKYTQIPILFISAKSEEVDRLLGFAIGADDYITKPIKPKLLVSKVKALLRRLKDKEQNSETLNVGGIEINREEYKIVKDNIEIVLPRKEFELFYLLASKPGKVFKRDEILDRVWGNEVVVGGRTIDVHIRKLREKIGEELFKTIKGVGYKFEV